MPSVLPGIIIAVVVFVLVIGFCVRMIITTSQTKAAGSRAARKLQVRTGASKAITALHIAGLPISEGSPCCLALLKSGIVIERSGTEFNLPFEKITDMCVRSETDIRKAYVSSVGGAVGGAVLFGPLGAMIGGRVKEKTDKIVHSYFIVTYMKEGVTDYLSFDCTDAPGVSHFVKAYHTVPKERKTVDL